MCDVGGESDGVFQFDNDGNWILAGLLPIPIRWSVDLGKLFANRPYATDELFVSISNTIKQHRAEIESHRNLYWRIVHLFVKRPDPDIIEIDGMRLKQLVEFFDPDYAARLQPGETYKVKLTELTRIIDGALQALSASAESRTAP